MVSVLKSISKNFSFRGKGIKNNPNEHVPFHVLWQQVHLFFECRVVLQKVHQLFASVLWQLLLKDEPDVLFHRGMCRIYHRWKHPFLWHTKWWWQVHVQQRIIHYAEIL